MALLLMGGSAVSKGTGDLCTLLLVFMGDRCTRGVGALGVRCTFGVLVATLVVEGIGVFSSLGVCDLFGVVFIGVTRRGVDDDDDDGGSSSACNIKGVYGIKESIVSSSSMVSMESRGGMVLWRLLKA